MKRIVFILALIFLVVGVQAQNSPFAGFFHKTSPKLVAANAKFPLTGTWLIRWDVGLTCPSFGLKQDEIGKITGIEGRDYSKLFGGFLFTHIKPDGSRDWGAGAGISVPYINGGKYGVAILGGYSVFRIGLNYDFGLTLPEGLSFLGGITVDLFNLTEQ